MRNLTTMTRFVLGQGHVTEDHNPTPIAFRNPEPKPPTDDPAPEDNQQDPLPENQ